MQKQLHGYNSVAADTPFFYEIFQQKIVIWLKQSVVAATHFFKEIFQQMNLCDLLYKVWHFAKSLASVVTAARTCLSPH